MIFSRFKDVAKVAAILLGLASALGAAQARAYKGAIVMDAATGKVLFEDNADVVSPPASMTKLMTYAVLDDKIRSGALSLTTPVTATRADARVGSMKDSTSVWLREKETFTVEELIYAMMIQSANDAAYALSHTAAPSVDAFVLLMNAKARELGMTRTTFRSPNGFPPPSRRVSEGDLTTPRDFALLCRYLVQKTDILKYTSVKTRWFGQGVRSAPTQMTNHNHLLGRVAGVDGLKTGFTSGAGFCLSATAIRNGHRVIVVMMDCENTKTRDIGVAQLLNRGFDSIPIGSAPFVASPHYGPAAAGPSPQALPVAPTTPTRPAPETSPPPAPPGGPAIHFSVPGH